MRASFETTTVDLGECDCPGRPHDRDEAVVKDHFSFGDLRRIAWSMGQDEMLSQSVTIACGIVSWNLVRRAVDGLGQARGVEPVPISTKDDLRAAVASVDDLDPRQSSILVEVFSRKTYTEQLRRQFGLPPEVETEVPNDGTLPPASGETSGDGLAEPTSSTSEISTPAL